MTARHRQGREGGGSFAIIMLRHLMLMFSIGPKAPPRRFLQRRNARKTFSQEEAQMVVPKGRQEDRGGVSNV